jgi:hypothetical protein
VALEREGHEEDVRLLRRHACLPRALVP